MSVSDSEFQAALRCVQLAIERGVVEINRPYMGNWLPQDPKDLTISFHNDYRIKPQPIEAWCVVYSDDSFMHCVDREVAVDICPSTCRVAKFREVIE